MTPRLRALAVAVLCLAASPARAVLVHYSTAGTVSAISPQTPLNSLAPLAVGAPVTLDWSVEIPLPVPSGPSLSYEPTQVVLTVAGYVYALHPTAVAVRDMMLIDGSQSGEFQSDGIDLEAPLTRRTGDPSDPLGFVDGLLYLTLRLGDPSGMLMQGLTPQSGSLAFPNRLAYLDGTDRLLDFEVTDLEVTVPEPTAWALLALGSAVLAGRFGATDPAS